MANEITALTGDGRGGYSMLLLFPITTPAQFGTPAQNVVPTPSAALPPHADAILDATEKAALDAGTLAFRVVAFEKQGITGAALVTRVRQLYAAEQAAFNAWYQETFRHLGTRINAV